MMDKENIEKQLGCLDKVNTKGELENSHYYTQISEIMKKIHSQIPKVDYDESKVPAQSDIREEYFEGENYGRAVIYLMSNGCEWALKSGNGCTMCGHLAKQTRGDRKVSDENHLSQFMDEYSKIDFSRIPLLNIYNNGSFLNDNEISANVRQNILKIINSNPHIKMLVLETRPEFVTEEKIREIKQYIPDKHVEIAIGLEIIDDSMRTICINKGFNLKDYTKAAAIVTKYLNLRTYVLLKPPLIMEKEAIDYAIETIKYAFSVGSATVSLEACTIQEYTLAKYLKNMNQYTPPWLWSIVEVLKATAHLGKLIVGLFQFLPSPEEVPYNCDKCSGIVMDKIKEYNRSLDCRIFEGLDCECIEKWKKELEKDISFHQRLAILKDYQDDPLSLG